uniref:Uncharacterized protein n=1 Tax=Thermogemmatispora argillosa TaxID=2045280 RepID=A0A455SWL3_9CHLR|nr:hypothetical protein KTA_01650 [Thermogemmatispora argillosa]
MARLCQLAARLILVLGLVTAAAEIYLLWNTYHYILQSGYSLSDGISIPQGFSYVRMGGVSWLDLVGPVAFLFGTIATTIFYSLLLSLIGHVLSAIAGSRPAGTSSERISASEEELTDGLIFQPLDEVETSERGRDRQRR